MRLIKLPKKAPLATLGIAALLVIVLAAVGSSVGVSQEEGPDVCEGYENEEYAFCRAYCVDLDCDSDFPVGSAEMCLYTFDRFTGLAEEVLPCEGP